MKMKSLTEARVDRLFKNAPDRIEEERCNPVTGSRWVIGLDPIEEQKQAAYRALRAGAWFAENGPPDAPPLPLKHHEREKLKIGGLTHVVAWFARSLEYLEYDYETHPSFDEYARGVMASPYAPDSIKQDEALLKRYPPRPLDGLGPGLYWEPAKPHSNSRKRRSG